MTKDLGDYERKKAFFTDIGYSDGGLVEDSKFEKRFAVMYEVRGGKLLGYVSRLFKEGKTNYFLHILKLIEDEYPRWVTIEDFMEVPEGSKLGRDLIKLENQGIF